MSGDVQPRKRKDKKKKRDDSDAKAADLIARKMSVLLDDDEPKEKSPTGLHATKMGLDDIQLHVHSDHGTGGHWCAKILFFSLMAILLGLIGLILLENRGISDLDTPLSESRFAEYLDGWVDEKRESHDDHDVLESLNDELDDHDHDTQQFEEEEENNHKEEDDDDDNHSEEEEEEEINENNQEGEIDSGEDNDGPDVENDDQENEENDNQEEENDNPEDKDNNNQEDVENDSPDEENSPSSNEIDDDGQDSSEDGKDNNEIEKDDIDDNDEGFEDQLSDDNIDDDDDTRPFEEHVSKANTNPSSKQITDTTYVSAEDLKNQVDELYGEFNKLAESLNFTKVKADDEDVSNIESYRKVKENDDDDDDDDDDASNEQFIDNDKGEDLHLQKLTEKEAAENQNDDDDQQEESSSLTVKLGVGLALVVVAHLVLVKRSKSNDDEKIEPSEIESIDLKRRFTLITATEPIPSDVDDEQPNEEEEEELEDEVKRSGPQDDDEFEDELRRTNDMLYDNPTSALKSFELLIEIKPNSSKAWYGKGQALDTMSEEQKSNEILKDAIAAYVKAVEFGSSVDDETFKIYAEHCINRMRFIGQHLKAVPVHEALIVRFNDNPYYRNQLAVTYLLINLLADAKLVLHETLLRWRQDGFALVHYGFVLKNLDKNNEAAVAFLQEGIDTDAEGTNDGRFYFNLGEALSRLGRSKEAMTVYRKGASKKLFLSEYQRSLYNVDRLQSHPFWTKKETGYKRYLEILEQNWEKIRDEGLSVLNERGHFTDESENLRDVGDWKQFDLFPRGRKVVKHCEKTPFTCKIIETFPAARFCKRGQVKFSVMHPNTHVWPHCGPTNCRIRVHLGLKVPAKTFIRVATETRSWKEGELLIFDDSFEHEVWHNGTQVRLVLIVDVWHPDLTEEERTNLYPI